MISEMLDKKLKRHVGKNIQRVRVYFGVKQDSLATDLGMSQQAISKIEQQEEIDDELLTKISDILGVSSDLIRNFDEERAVYNINSNNYRDATISEGGTAIATAQQINPIEKIVELYERLLQSEREKIELLQKNNSGLSHQ